MNHRRPYLSTRVPGTSDDRRAFPTFVGASASSAKLRRAYATLARVLLYGMTARIRHRSQVYNPDIYQCNIIDIHR
jgi:hypothetical protein